MLPLFKEGEIVLVEDNSHKPQVTSRRLPTFQRVQWPPRSNPLSSAISPGDCAVYEVGGKRLLHRVIGKEAGGLWFSDDAGLLRPHFAPWERIEGKVLSGNPLKNGLIGLGYAGLRRFLSGICRRQIPEG